MKKTLEGHGLKVIEVEGEDIDALWGAVSSIVVHQGPAAGKFFIRQHPDPHLSRLYSCG